MTLHSSIDMKTAPMGMGILGISFKSHPAVANCREVNS